jgi:hypothetical protein
MEKKPKNGIYKCSGEQISEEQQEEELFLLNPMDRAKGVASIKPSINVGIIILLQSVVKL